jgi:hypothetical protein
MNAGWQEMLLYIVFAIGTAVSLFAFFWGRRLRAGMLPRALRDDPVFASFLENGPGVGGEIEVEAPALRPLMDLLALQIENPKNFMQSVWVKQGGPPGSVHVERTGENEIQFTAEGLLVSGGLLRAEIGSPNRTVRVRWALRLSGSTTLVTIGMLWALCLGVPASILVPILIYVYVLPSANPAVRAQALQVIQICHVLWEPYLFFGIANQRSKTTGRYMEMLISAAAFEARTGQSSSK